MNKIFKVIWNKTTQSLVVTSELARGAVKSSSDNSASSESQGARAKKVGQKALLFSAAALSLLSAMNPANAAYTTVNGTGTGDGIAISGCSTGRAIAGINVNGRTTGNIAIGTLAEADGGNSVAMGYLAKSHGNGATAVGQGAL